MLLKRTLNCISLMDSCCAFRACLKSCLFWWWTRELLVSARVDKFVLMDYDGGTIAGCGVSGSQIEVHLSIFLCFQG